jgi:TolB-like protein
MRNLFIVCVVFALCCLAKGEPASGALTDSPSKVLVLPFARISGNAPDDAADPFFVEDGLHEALSIDLRRAGKIEAVTIKVAAKPDRFNLETAVEEARKQGAATVIFGSVQHLDREIRILGAIADVRTGRTLRTLKATGDIRDAFELEDSICGQARRTLEPASLVTAQVPSTQPAYVDPGPIKNPYAIQIEDPAVTRSRDRLRSSVDYAYPYYGCGYYGGCGIYYSSYATSFYGGYGR